MNQECEETVIRFVRLRDEQKPVEIYVGNPPAPINPDWVAITHGILRWDRRPDGIDGFNLAFFMDDGRCLTSIQCDTLQIAIDQATLIVGIHPDEWKLCQVEITDDDGTIPWSSVIQ